MVQSAGLRAEGRATGYNKVFRATVCTARNDVSLVAIFYRRRIIDPGFAGCDSLFDMLWRDGGSLMQVILVFEIAGLQGRQQLEAIGLTCVRPEFKPCRDM
jgi:hypothetical protein